VSKRLTIPAPSAMASIPRAPLPPTRPPA